MLAVLLAAAVASGVLTGAMRRYALARSILDIPNSRSSHTQPVPRGGGLAIAAVLGAGMLLLTLAGLVSTDVAAALLGGGTLVAGIGWADDRRSIPASGRATAHALAACWVLFWLGGLPTLSLGTAELHLGLLGYPLAVVLVVWLTNLYNFMDGIDGIAGVEAVCVGAVGGALLLVAGQPGLGSIALLVAAASFGFLLWNWSPARIFMGDVGSGLLGFLFGSLAVASENAGAVPLTVWVLLLGVFVFDSTVTLTRRVLRGERWYAAHRSHAYQRAVQSGMSHARVSSMVLLLNLLLVAAAVAAWARPSLLMPASLLGVAALALCYRAVERLRPM